jgi:hypothetical protein
MQQHQQLLPNAITQRIALPQTSPLPQDVRRAGRASPNSLINAKLNLNDIGIGMADRHHLPRKNNLGLIGELMQNIDNRLRRCRGRCRQLLPASHGSRQHHAKRTRTQSRSHSQNPAHAILPSPVFRQERVRLTAVA